MLERRKKKLIDRNVQVKVAFIVLSYVLVYLLLFALFIFVPLAYQIQTEVVFSSKLQEGANAFITLHKHFWPAALMVLLIISFHSIRISHRIAGPVFRFKETMKMIQKKDLSVDTFIRKGDFFADLMEEINRAIKSLREGIEDIREKDEKVYQAIQGLTERINRGDIPLEELKESVLRINKDEEELRQLLKWFKVNPPIKDPDVKIKNEED